MAESQKTDENSATTKEEYTETVNVSAVSIWYLFCLKKDSNIKHGLFF